MQLLINFLQSNFEERISAYTNGVPCSTCRKVSESSHLSPDQMDGKCQCMSLQHHPLPSTPIQKKTERKNFIYSCHNILPASPEIITSTLVPEKTLDGF
jgi:hypothetical protein